MNVPNHRIPIACRFAGALVLALLATTSARSARALEIIPSVGATRSTDTNAADAKAFGGIALRAPLFPFLKLEGGIAYRQDTFLHGDLKERQWPVTASAWVSPLPFVYAGGGIGWYRTTLHFADALQIKDTTSDKMGVHLGGGLDVPVAPKLALDLNGRYVFMKKDNATLEVPTTFNPDFWNLSLGLAVKF